MDLINILIGTLSIVLGILLIKYYKHLKSKNKSGNIITDLMTTDFEIFKRELKFLYDNLNGVSVFEGCDSQITIHIKGDGIGHFTTKCFLTDNFIDGNELKCEIHFDQTQIPKLIGQVKRITTEFPTTVIRKYRTNKNPTTTTQKSKTLNKLPLFRKGIGEEKG